MKGHLTDAMESLQVNSDHPSVRDYFKGKSIFMTGSTGFVGRFLIYKLLKDCDIKMIYILMRPKKGLNVQERFETFRNLELFTFLADKNQLDKIVPLAGDITLPSCGLSSVDIKLITDNVDIVYHSAATVKFTEPLK